MGFIKAIWQKLVDLSDRMDKAANEKAAQSGSWYREQKELLKPLYDEECRLINEYVAGRLDGETYHQARKVIKDEINRIKGRE